MQEGVEKLETLLCQNTSKEEEKELDRNSISIQNR